MLFYRAILDGWLDRKPGKDPMHIRLTLSGAGLAKTK